MELSGCGQRSPGSRADDCFPSNRASTARGLPPEATRHAERSADQRLAALVSLQAASTARIRGMASKHASVATISDSDEEGLNSNLP